MSTNGPEAWREAMENSLEGVLQHMQGVAVMQDGICSPPCPELERYATYMKALRLEEVLLEFGAEQMLIVKHGYDEAYALVRYGDEVNAVEVSKLIRITFSRKMDALRANGKNYLATGVVDANVKRWERSIALVFGERYASKLLDSALSGRDLGATTLQNLGEVRAFLTSAIGECLIFEPEKVDK